MQHWTCCHSGLECLL